MLQLCSFCNPMYKQNKLSRNTNFLPSLLWNLQRLIDGADEYLLLLDVSSNTMQALCNMPQEFSYDN